MAPRNDMALYTPDPMRQTLSLTSKLSSDMLGILVLDLEQLDNIDLKKQRLSDFQG